VVATISAPSIGGIAVGAEAVWVANLGPGTVTRIDPQTNDVAATIQIGDRSANLGFGPTFLAFGHGSLWVLDGASSSVFRVDPQTNRIVASLSLGSGTQGTTAPLGIAVSADAVWVANRWGTDYGPDGSVVRIDPLTNRIVASLGLGTRPDGGGPTMLAAGSEAVWVGVPSTRSIARIDPATASVVATLPDLECAAGQLALAQDESSVWVADCTAVRRIDTETNTIAKTIPIPGATIEPGVQAVAIGFGSVWAQGGRLVRIDPASGALTGALPLTELGVPCGYSIAFGFGSVWVRQVEQVIRIRP
jgi:streptogramin lyase